MKIIKKGMFDNDGIYMDCPYCSAVFLIEGRKDFSVVIDTDLFDHRCVVGYQTTCPSCKQTIYMGYIDEPKYLGRYGYLRNRKDWTERYQIKKEKTNEKLS